MTNDSLLSNKYTGSRQYSRHVCKHSFDMLSSDTITIPRSNARKARAVELTRHDNMRTLRSTRTLEAHDQGVGGMWYTVSSGPDARRNHSSADDTFGLWLGQPCFQPRLQRAICSYVRTAGILQAIRHQAVFERHRDDVVIISSAKRRQLRRAGLET